ncbi:MAG TPA: methyltransferase domain-containing protein [Gaiellaceae bacterium]|jgi:SAM-dependent methyltransferase
MSWHEIVERDHDLQNPTSGEKIELVGEYLRLAPRMRVLDIACGKCGPAILLAERFDCSIHGIELRESFASEGRERVAAAGLTDLVEIEVANAAEVALEHEAWDVAVCFGAAFVWGHIGDAAREIVPAVKQGGGVAIGEPYWRELGREGEDFVDLPATVARFESAGLDLIGMAAASEDDWDRYESLHWRAAVEEIAAGADAEFAATHREHVDRHLRWRRTELGWAIFAGRKR